MYIIAVSTTIDSHAMILCFVELKIVHVEELSCPHNSHCMFLNLNSAIDIYYNTYNQIHNNITFLTLGPMTYLL